MKRDEVYRLAIPAGTGRVRDMPTARAYGFTGRRQSFEQFRTKTASRQLAAQVWMLTQDTANQNAPPER